MLKSSNISVIIPSAHNQNALKIVVLSICKQTTKPKEIIIVDSSLNGGLCSPDIEYLCLINGINLIYKYQNQSMPGKARNIGLSLSSGNIVAFIDVETIPKIHWLNSSVDTISNRSVEGVWGATSFSASSKFEKLVRDSFFGTLPRKTLPGSVFLRDVFVKTGYFIDWSRAGEDTEWMLRVEVLKIPIIQNSTGLIDYVGLIGSDMTKVMKKWYRNYSTSRNLPHFYPQRLLIWLVLYPLFVLVAFNWNYLVADWQTDSPFYLGHVTKTVAILPFIIYTILRGIVLPLYRGVSILQLLPLRFILIVIICLAADTLKILIFTCPKRKIK